MKFDGSILKDELETVVAEGSLEDSSMEKSSGVLVGKERVTCEMKKKKNNPN